MLQMSKLLWSSNTHCLASTSSRLQETLPLLSRHQTGSSLSIGVGRFTILGGQGLEYWGGQGGPNSQQAHDVVMTSMRRNDVASTSFRRHVPNRFLINQCQIITFLILKYVIENSRIKLRGIVLPVQVGGLLGGPKGMLAPPPLKLLGGPPPAPPPPLFLRLCFPPPLAPTSARGRRAHTGFFSPSLTDVIRCYAH